MNTSIGLSYVIAFFIMLSGCSGQPNQNQQAKNNLLTLKVSAVSQLPVGYGIRYNCDVKSVKKGELADKKIGLMLLHSNYSDTMDKKGVLPGIRIFTFKRSGKNKADNYPTVNGFIAEDRTVWEVVDMN